MIGIQDPVVAFPILSSLRRQFHETFVQRQVVSDGIAPALVFPISIVRKMLCNVVVYSVERKSLFLRTLDRHGD